MPTEILKLISRPKVYVLTSTYDKDEVFHGVFTTREKAQKFWDTECLWRSSEPFIDEVYLDTGND
jgi:hypothetical protein